MNLNYYNYYSPEWPFIDIFTRVGGWAEDIKGGGGGGTITTDTDGWPLLTTVGAWDAETVGDQIARATIPATASVLNTAMKI